MSEKWDEGVAAWLFWGSVQAITYVMCIIRWFVTDHYSFWHGFKELIWVLVPILNFTYVWDWWMNTVVFIFGSIFFILKGLFMAVLSIF